MHPRLGSGAIPVVAGGGLLGAGGAAATAGIRSTLPTGSTRAGGVACAHLLLLGEGRVGVVTIGVVTITIVL